MPDYLQAVARTLRLPLLRLAADMTVGVMKTEIDQIIHTHIPMATNAIPNNPAQIIYLGTNMLAGLTSLGTTLGITQINPGDFQTVLDGYINAENSFDASRSAKQTALDGWKGATGALFDWLLVVRTVLAGRFGNRWSTEWAQAGFTNASSAVPKRIEGQLDLALSLKSFFTANPSWQVASMLVTAAQATTLRSAALAAHQVVLTAEQNIVTSRADRTLASDGLIAMMRALIKILGATISATDVRWLAFGLNIPATNTTPGKPTGLTVSLDATGALLVQCDATPLGTRYRWRMRVVGAQSRYQLAARSVDPMATISNVLPGDTVEVIVQAVNGTLQGVASDAVTFTVPAAVPAPAVAKKAEAAPAGEPSNGNGNGNGNGHSIRGR